VAWGKIQCQILWTWWRTYFGCIKAQNPIPSWRAAFKDRPCGMEKYLVSNETTGPFNSQWVPVFIQNWVTNGPRPGTSCSSWSSSNCYNVKWGEEKKRCILQFVHATIYNSPHHSAIFKATESIQPPPPHHYRAALSHQYSVASVSTLQVLSCLLLPGLRCSRYSVVQFAVTSEHAVAVLCDLFIDAFSSHQHNYNVKWCYG
jgi:hypothetical protein